MKPDLQYVFVSMRVLYSFVFLLIKALVVNVFSQAICILIEHF